MKASEIAGLPFQLGSALRHRRVFHPVGVLASGSIQRLAPPSEGLPVESSEIVGRVSKAAGAPGSLPDIAGLAWRFPLTAAVATPWDVLLASAGSGLLTRVLLRPVTSWAGASFSSLMPLGYQGGVWWVRARLASEIDAPGLSLDTIADRVSHGGLDFDLEQASGTGDFQALAHLTFDRVIPTDDPSQDVAFDPTRHSAPGVSLLPGWLTDIRRGAYSRSRRGRDAG
jgi:hypothetical protein